MSKYLLYKANNKNYIAYSLSDLNLVLNYFPATTWRKKLIKYYICLCGKLNVELFGIKLCDDFEIYNGITFEKLFFNLVSPSDSVFVLWNRGGNRKGRVYVWRFDSDAELRSFFKVVDNEACRHALKNEKDTLELLSVLPKKFSHPQVIQYIEHGKLTLLETTAAPLGKLCSSTINSLQSHKVIHSISKIDSDNRVYTLEDISSELWWKKLQLLTTAETLLQLKTKFCDSFFSMGFIHGDFGSENVYFCNDEIWVVDWEASTSVGPILTDYIAFWLGKNDKNNKRLFDGFHAKFLEHDCHRVEDVVAAILFLTSYQFPPAVRIFAYWSNQDFSQL